MTTNFGMIIDRESWEAYIVNPFSLMVSISREGRSSPNRKNSLAERGLTIRDKIINQRIFIPAVGALEILKDHAGSGDLENQWHGDRGTRVNISPAR